MEKENLKIIVLIAVMVITFVVSIIILIRFNNEDKNAFEKCKQTYDTKSCEKFIYGNY